MVASWQLGFVTTGTLGLFQGEQAVCFGGVETYCYSELDPACSDENDQW